MRRFDASRILSIFNATALVALCTAVICGHAWANDDMAQPPDIKELQGKWIMIANEINGRQIAVPENNWISIEGTRFVRRYAGATAEGQIKVNSKANPKQLDFYEMKWFDPCIYRFDSFKLEICGPPVDGVERPTVFESKSNHRIEIYMRLMR